jgi:hypothetical protein
LTFKNLSLFGVYNNDTWGWTWLHFRMLGIPSLSPILRVSFPKLWGPQPWRKQWFHSAHALWQRLMSVVLGFLNPHFPPLLECLAETGVPLSTAVNCPSWWCGSLLRGTESSSHYPEEELGRDRGDCYYFLEHKEEN